MDSAPTHGAHVVKTHHDDRLSDVSCEYATQGSSQGAIPQMTWFWGRFGMKSTFVHTWEPKIDRATRKTAQMQNQAWMVQGEFALTDDEPAFNHVTPKRPFDGTGDSFKRGHWGGLDARRALFRTGAGPHDLCVEFRGCDPICENRQGIQTCDQLVCGPGVPPAEYVGTHRLQRRNVRLRWQERRIS